ncbi:MAG: nucleotidyltransferase family protein [Muribaculaceae bacterium]|nr:nucleotidyltransferase family protein [Muribaculaceae bacterium]
MDSIDIFFSLLRSGMYGVPIPESDLPEQIDWESIIRLARKQVVYGIIIDSIQFLPPRLRPSGHVAAKMNKFALGLIQTNIILDNAVGRLVTFFKQHGLNGVLLKGQGVAHSYYRMSQTRQSGDIDFYVGKRIYKQAVALCEKHLAENLNESGESEQHFGFFMSGIWIELHRLASRIYSPLRNRRFQRWVVEQLEHSDTRRTVTLGDTAVTLPSYDFDAIFIFYHAWRHFIMGGIGLRQLCDWTLIFHSHGSEIDKTRLTENLHRFGMIKGWKLFACIAVRHLGIEAEKMPLYDPSYAEKSEKILAEILAGGNFGYYSKANTSEK